MDTQELKDQFRNLYKQMAESKDVDQMIIFGEVFKRMYDKVATTFYKMAVKRLKDVDRPKFIRWYFGEK